MDEAEGRRMAPTDERLARDKHGQEAGVAIQAADRTSILQVTPNDGGKGSESGLPQILGPTGFYMRIARSARLA